MGIRISCVICTLPRSGSWYLAEALQSAGVGRPEEYFREDWLWRYAWHGHLECEHLLDRWPPARLKGRSRPDPGMVDVDGFTAEVRRVATTGNGVLGVKVHLSQFEEFAVDARRAGAAGVLCDEQTLRAWFPNPRYVLLTRRDHLRQAISHYRAIETDKWWTTQPRPADEDHLALMPAHKPIDPERRGTVDPDLSQVEQLRRMLVSQEERWRRILATADGSVLELTYEDLFTDPAAAVNAVLRHVELPELRDPGTGSRLRRQADAVTERTVERYHRWRLQAMPVPWPSPAAEPARPRRQTMRTETLVVDNFYADPAAVRRYALSQAYYYPYEREADVESGRTPATWMASRFKSAKECPFKSSDDLITALEQITAEEVDRDRWRADFPVDEAGRPQRDFQSALDRSCLWNCSFHLKPDNGQKLGEGVHNHVVDGWNGVDINGWAGIIYLSPDAPLSGGLQLWRNKNPDRQFDWMTPGEDWELVDKFGNVPNRLLLCRGSISHSGARGWGDTLENGRLFQTFFFRTLRPSKASSLVIPL